jgi:A/G-specific adenine glycosylase
MPTPPITTFAPSLIAWYHQQHRAMPWRTAALAPHGPHPYPVWIAEVMLQQTTVTTVIPYFERFMAAFPTVAALAAAPVPQVLHLWQGLGYYRRAHQLHRCAQVIVTQHQGQFPTTLAGLLALPGIGPYTAAAILTTAFNQPGTVVDGNVERVVSRLFHLTQPLPAAKKIFIEHATQLAAAPAAVAQPRLYANAIMELGSQVCTPTQPRCPSCPVAACCAVANQPIANQLPFKTAKPKLPHQHATVWLIQSSPHNIYLQQRPTTGLLAGLHELPHSGWEPKATPQTPPLPLAHTTNCGTVNHTFTHFKLTLQVHHARVAHLPAAHTFALNNLPPLPTLMRKALKHLPA